MHCTCSNLLNCSHTASVHRYVNILQLCIDFCQNNVPVLVLASDDGTWHQHQSGTEYWHHLFLVGANENKMKTKWKHFQGNYSTKHYVATDRDLLKTTMGTHCQSKATIREGIDYLDEHSLVHSAQESDTSVLLPSDSFQLGTGCMQQNKANAIRGNPTIRAESTPATMLWNLTRPWHSIPMKTLPPISTDH